MYRPTVDEQLEFVKTSSEIEGEYSHEAAIDHLEAWNYLKVQERLTMSVLLECHRLLQQRLRPDIAGRFRTVDVWVGGASCPPPMLVYELLEKWLSHYSEPNCFHEINHNKKYLEETIEWSHVRFEEIHPFEDGNGRVGRCLMNWTRINYDLPLLIIHPGPEQQEYYKWFRNRFPNKQDDS